jgi:hypothetical protein
MSRNRLLYQSEAIFITSGLATGYMFNTGLNPNLITGSNSGNNLLLQLSRIQSAGQDFAITRVDVNQEGQLARIDAIITEAPTVNFNTSWFITDGSNEQKAGLVIDGRTSCISGLITKANEPKNIFVLQTAEGTDANNNSSINTTNDGVISIGNAFLSNISWNAAVGQIPTCTAAWEAFNIKYDTGTQNLSTPAINISNGLPITGINFSIPTASSLTGLNIPSAIKPGDVTVTAANGTALGLYSSGVNACPVQNFTLTVPLARTKLNKLGSLFSYSLEPQFPIKPTLSMQVYQTDLRNSSLDQVLCNDQFSDININMKNPACGGTGADAVIFTLKRNKLISQNHSNALGDIAKTVTLNYEMSLGGPTDNVNGVFISGQGAF